MIVCEVLKFYKNQHFLYAILPSSGDLRTPYFIVLTLGELTIISGIFELSTTFLARPIFE